MTFPHIKLKTTNFTVTPQVEELLEQKLEPLGKFIDDRVETLCEVELEKVAEHQSGKIFRAEVNLHIDGKLFRAEATEEQIEQSIDIVRNELKTELQRAQEKRISLEREGGRILKQMIQSEEV